MSITLQTFIRAVEYWVPCADGGLLEFGDGLYGTGRHLEALSRQMCFGREEGLPGQAWVAGHPLILKKFEGSYFRRTAAAHAVGITCGIALPLFADGALTAVLVLFCGEGTARAGAIELWRNLPPESTGMALLDGHYGNTGTAFERASQGTVLPKGTGLPGKAWESRKPVFQADLGVGSGFVRAQTAEQVGINRGLALPCSTVDGSTQVLTFLSAQATPIARRIEIWEPASSSSTTPASFDLKAGFCEVEGVLSAEPGQVAMQSSDDFLVQVCTSRAPVIRKPSGDSNRGNRVAWPVLFEGTVTAVVALDL